LEKNFLHRILVVEVLPTPFRPKVVQDEAPEDVERLAGVRVAPGVIREVARGVVFELHGGFPKEHKRPNDLEVATSFPFSPYALVGLPGLLSHGIVEQAVLRGLLSARVADLAIGRDTHGLEP